MTDMIFLPVIPVQMLIVLLCVIGIIILAAVFLRGRRGFLPRILTGAIIAAVLSGPVLREERREYLPDKALIVIDKSASQKLGERDKNSLRIAAELEKTLKSRSGIDVRVVEAAQDSDTTGRTDVFSALERLPFDATSGRLAATFLITDGQVHDVPRAFDRFRRFAPLHVLLSGREDEFDRKVTILSAPKFAIVGQEVKIPVRLDIASANASRDDVVAVSLRQNGEMTDTVFLKGDEVRELSVKIDRPGQNVFEFSIPADGRDLTGVNDYAAVIVNGVRDRLKVLLVSGSPHMGERAWRNLLKSDPSIDMVHFTILRSPFSYDPAAPNELSLIAFPADELFLHKVGEFDLIIFDRFSKYNLIEEAYVDSIKRYVKEGGGLLMTLGTGSWSEDDERGLGPLAPILPIALANNDVDKRPFRPELTAQGASHPVTQPLVSWRASRDWGEWQASRRARALAGDVLLTGADKNPLLVLNAVDKGRVAVLTSDHFWIWSKGGAEAGPYVDLLRNVAHWLMKEPELEKDFLKAEARGLNIVAFRRKDSETPPEISIISPARETVKIKPVFEAGWWTGRATVKARGVYTVSDGDKSVFVAVGDSASDREAAEVVTTAQKLQPMQQEMNGGIFWQGRAPDTLPALRDLTPDARNLFGDTWAGLLRHKAFVASREEAIRVFSWPFSFFLIMLAVILCWLIEGRKK
jgi:uncharacterized membrane protein